MPVSPALPDRLVPEVALDASELAETDLRNADVRRLNENPPPLDLGGDGEVSLSGARLWFWFSSCVSVLKREP